MTELRPWPLETGLFLITKNKVEKVLFALLKGHSSHKTGDKPDTCVSLRGHNPHNAEGQFVGQAQIFGPKWSHPGGHKVDDMCGLQSLQEVETTF